MLPDQPRWHGEAPLRLESLQEEPFLLYTRAFTLSERLEQACQEAGFVPQVAARSSQWDFLTAMVRSGMGVAFLPEPVCHRLTPDGLVLRPLEPELSWRLGVIWPSERYLSPHCRGTAGPLPPAAGTSVIAEAIGLRIVEVGAVIEADPVEEGIIQPQQSALGELGKSDGRAKALAPQRL